MLVQSQNKLSRVQISSEKFEVVKHRKFRKPTNTENEGLQCRGK